MRSGSARAGAAADRWRLRHPAESGALKIVARPKKLRADLFIARTVSCDSFRANHPKEKQENPTNTPRRHGDATFLAMSAAATDIKEFQLHEGDTGSADVQIARLSWRITELTEHLNNHKKDFSSRRGLLKLVSQRRKLLDYLAATDGDRYQKILKSLKLRR